MLHRCSFLALVTLMLVACSKDPLSTYPQRRAGRGEPCAVLNDCKEPLLCLAGRCLDAKPAVAATNKQCVVGECLSDSDCCPPPNASLANMCRKLEEECELGFQFSCEEHRSRCTCGATCQDYQCSRSPIQGECSVDSECGFGNVCYQQRCMECAFDVNCTEGRVCVAERCQLACTNDGHCGAFEACGEDGRCQARGCLNDRECVSLLRRRDAVCRADECVVPCTNDAVCADYLTLGSCDDGVCRDLGCQENADCEARLGLPDRAIALCLDADEARALQSRPTQIGETFQ